MLVSTPQKGNKVGKEVEEFAQATLPSAVELSPEEKEVQIGKYRKVAVSNMIYLNNLSRMGNAEGSSGFTDFSGELFKERGEKLSKLANFEEGKEVKAQYQEDLERLGSTVSVLVNNTAEEILKKDVKNFENLSAYEQKQLNTLYLRLSYNLDLVKVIDNLKGIESNPNNEINKKAESIIELLKQHLPDQQILADQINSIKKEDITNNLTLLKELGRELGQLKSIQDMNRFLAAESTINPLGDNLALSVKTLSENFNVIVSETNRELKPITDDITKGLIKLEDLSVYSKIRASAEEINTLVKDLGDLVGAEPESLLLVNNPRFSLSREIDESGKHVVMNALNPLIGSEHDKLIGSTKERDNEKAQEAIKNIGNMYSLMRDLSIEDRSKDYKPDPVIYDKLDQALIEQKVDILNEALDKISSGGVVGDTFNRDLAFNTFLNIRLKEVEDGRSISQYSVSTLDKGKIALAEDKSQPLIKKAVDIVLKADSVENKQEAFKAMATILKYCDGKITEESKHDLSKILSQGSKEDAKYLGQALAQAFSGIDVIEELSFLSLEDINSVRDFISFNFSNIVYSNAISEGKFENIPIAATFGYEFVKGNDSLHSRTLKAFGFSVLEDKQNDKERAPVYEDRVVRGDVKEDLPSLHSFLLDIVDSAQFSRSAAKRLTGLEDERRIGKNEEHVMINSVVSLDNFISQLPDQNELREAQKGLITTVPGREGKIFNEDITSALRSQYLNSVLGSGMLYNVYALASPDSRTSALKMVLESITESGVSDVERAYYVSNLKYLLYGVSEDNKKEGSGILSNKTIDEKKIILDELIDSLEKGASKNQAMEVLMKVISSDFELEMYLEDKMNN